MPKFQYPCPDCRTTNAIHKPECDFEEQRRGEIEKAYIDVLSVLSAAEVDESELQNRVQGEWDRLHAAVLGVLKSRKRVMMDGDSLRLLTSDEYEEEVSEPTVEPVRTVYQHGSVPGCHDNAVFAMIAWYEMVDLSWEETREKVVSWLRDTGAWERGGFEESSPEELVDSKRRVYEEGYGWKQAAQEAKSVIEHH